MSPNTKYLLSGITSTPISCNLKSSVTTSLLRYGSSYALSFIYKVLSLYSILYDLTKDEDIKKTINQIRNGM